MNITQREVYFASKAQFYKWARMMRKTQQMQQIILSVDSIYGDGYMVLGKDQLKTSKGASQGRPQTAADGLGWALRTENPTWKHAGDRRMMDDIDARKGVLVIYTFTDELDDKPREGREAVG